MEYFIKSSIDDLDYLMFGNNKESVYVAKLYCNDETKDKLLKACNAYEENQKRIQELEEENASLRNILKEIQSAYNEWNSWGKGNYWLADTLSKIYAKYLEQLLKRAGE